MFCIKKPVLVLVLSIALIAGISLLSGTGYALWRHSTSVRFKLTILKPAEDDIGCVCGTYATIREGIDLLHIQHAKIRDRMDEFAARLQARIEEIEALPYGGITYEELKEERNRYVNVDIKNFRDYIITFGSHCINGLAKFYNQSSKEEKDQVPDFWEQHGILWDLSDELWDRHDGLYDLVNEFWKAGEKKIDW